MPEIFQNYFKTSKLVAHYDSRNMYNIFISVTHSSFGRRCITFKAGQLWNKLSNNVKNTKNLNEFKKVIKRILFDTL